MTIVGARPQFIKASVVSRALKALPGSPVREILVHTGQHFAKNMSDVFFDDLGIARPDFNLGIDSLSHGAMTARMLERLEELMLSDRPDMVLIYGDTNSTLAAALAAAKLHIPIAHVEAGLRSFNMRMAEEVNRILADRVSSLLLCPSVLAADNLRREGIHEGVHFVGDVMYDAVRVFGAVAEKKAPAGDIVRTPGNYVVATVHRAENTASLERLKNIVAAFKTIGRDTEIVLPLHPRTEKILDPKTFEELKASVHLIEPQSYTQMLSLQRGARAILTDSGGMQKEAYFHRVPCITLRDETEWPETVEMGWNRVVGADKELILEAWKARDEYSRSLDEEPYGNGYASEKIAELIQGTA